MLNLNREEQQQSSLEQRSSAVPEKGGTRVQAGGFPFGAAVPSELAGEEWSGVPVVQPASSTNRQVATRQRPDEGGEDTVDWGWLVSFPEKTLSQFREVLGKAQKAAQAEDVEGAQVRFGDHPFVVRPGGARVQGLYFAWVLEMNGWTLSVMDREQPWGETPNVRVHVGALPLLYFGLEDCHRLAKSVIEKAGGTIEGEKISRMDACLDVMGVPVNEFVEPFVAGRVVRRGKKVDLHWDGRETTGLTIGRGAVVLRVYDKIAECQNNAVKWDAMVQMRFGGEVPAEVTRVEFQLRRKVLKELGIDTIASWIEKRASVLDYLTAHWFRLTAEAVDVDHTERAAPSGLWQRVSEGFSSWAGVALLPAVRDRMKRKVLEIGGLMRQAFGCVTSAAAVRGVAITAWSDMCRFLLDQVEAFEAEHARPLVERYQVKRTMLEARYCLAT